MIRKNLNYFCAKDSKREFAQNMSMLECPSCGRLVFPSEFVEFQGEVACAGFCIDLKPNLSEKRARELVAKKAKSDRDADRARMGGLQPSAV